MPPFDNRSMRSVYHTREFDVGGLTPKECDTGIRRVSLQVFQMSQLSQPLDVVLSHDWPQGIAYHGNLDELLRWVGLGSALGWAGLLH